MPVPRAFAGPWKALRTIPRFFQSLMNLIVKILVRIATLPYYRLYHFNTVSPLEKIALLASISPPDNSKILLAVSFWRARKLTELQFVTIACTVLAAAVIGAFSWTNIEDAHWLTQGFWHTSLILSVLGILLSASEVAVQQLLGPLPQDGKRFHNDALERYRPLLMSPTNDPTQPFIPRKKMIFTWQSPLMFMSYSVCGFLAGLTVFVCTPLIRNGPQRSPGFNIAIMYLTVFAGASIVFVFSSFWVYHYIELDFDATVHEEPDETQTRDTSPLNFGNMLMPYSEENYSIVAHHP